MRQARGWVWPLVAVGIAEAAAALAVPAALGHAFDDLLSMRRDAGAWVPPPASVVATAGLVAALVGLGALGELLGGSGTARTTAGMRRRLAAHAVRVGPGAPDASSDRVADGDLVARLVGSTATAGRAVGSVADLAAAAIPPIGGVVALAVIDPALALTFAAGMIVVGGAVRTYLRDARLANAGYFEAQGAIAARLIDALAGARTIGAAGTAQAETRRVLAPLPALRRHGEQVWRNMARLAFQGEPVVLLTQVAVVAVAGAGLAAGRLSAGELLAASRYAVLAAGIGGLLDRLAGLARARAAASRVAEVLAQPAMGYGSRRAEPGPGELVLHGVTAGPAGAPVLDGVDLVVPGGSSVALVGRSGTGKSLLAAIAGRLCDPAAGEVRLDGVPLRELTRCELRRAVTYAFERPALVGATVEDAIGLGAGAGRRRIDEAAGSARARTFIRRLPGGFGAPVADTPLSGGEVQRIGLARALARDARVLILDDATSSLDTATEAEIAATLFEEMRDRTRLVVTHRSATAARADLVAWLDGGRVRAVASHDRLWLDPAYRAVFGAHEEAA